MEPRVPGDVPAIPAAEILPAGNVPALTLHYTPRTLNMVTLSHVELDTIASPSGSIHFGFFGIAFGAFVTSVVVLSTVDIISPKTYAAYIGAAIVTGVASAYFGVRAGIDFSDVRKRLRELKGDPAMPQLPR